MQKREKLGAPRVAISLEGDGRASVPRPERGRDEQEALVEWSLWGIKAASERIKICTTSPEEEAAPT